MSNFTTTLLAAIVACALVACAKDDDGGDADAAVAEDAATAATVAGTLTLPAMAAGKPYGVRVLADPASAPVAEASGLTGEGTSLSYSIADVPAGTYFLLGFVDVDESGGDSSTPGDFAGWHGHTGDGNPPTDPDVVVPASGSVTFDWSLVPR